MSASSATSTISASPYAAWLGNRRLRALPTLPEYLVWQAEVDGESIGEDFKGYVFRISGGNDKQGFPMVQGILSSGRVRLLLSKGSKAYRPRRTGERKRRSVFLSPFFWVPCRAHPCSTRLGPLTTVAFCPGARSVRPSGGE